MKEIEALGKTPALLTQIKSSFQSLVFSFEKYTAHQLKKIEILFQMADETESVKMRSLRVQEPIFSIFKEVPPTSKRKALVLRR